MEQKEDPGKEKEDPRKKKDPKASGTSVGYVPRKCPKPPYIKPCPKPIEVCKDPAEKDECPPPKNKDKGLSIDDAEEAERPKPPKCPPREDPCANDNIPPVVKPPEPAKYTCKPKKGTKKDPCATEDD